MWKEINAFQIDTNLRGMKYSLLHQVFIKLGNSKISFMICKVVCFVCGILVIQYVL